MLPPAPPRFSTTSGCPHTSGSFAESSRATRSAGPPAGKGTTMRTGLDGYGCAIAGAVKITQQRKTAANVRAEIVIAFLLVFDCTTAVHEVFLTVTCATAKRSRASSASRPVPQKD